MSVNDKNILITPNRGSTTNDPKIEFVGADSSTPGQTITALIYPEANGTLSFEGSAGQLFSATNDLSGVIFSVNLEDELPAVEIDDDGTIRLARFYGNVLIGTPETSKNEKLQIRDSVRYFSSDIQSSISQKMLNDGTLSFSGSAGELFSITDDLTGIIFSVNNASGLPSIEVIDDGTVRLAEFPGNVLIGTRIDNESDKLQVDGSVFASAFNNGSDVKLKKNIKQIENALKIVTALRGVRYDWKNETISPTIGVIAQEVEKVLPEVVFESANYKSVSYGNIIAVLIEAIKELKKEVDSLKK